MNDDKGQINVAETLEKLAVLRIENKHLREIAAAAVNLLREAELCAQQLRDEIEDSIEDVCTSYMVQVRKTLAAATIMRAALAAKPSAGKEGGRWKVNSRNTALRRLAKNITPADAEKLLDSLRWREDTVVVNDFGERVWLKPCYDASGKRIGITDCCSASEPCKHHAVIMTGKDQT